MPMAMWGRRGSSAVNQPIRGLSVSRPLLHNVWFKGSTATSTYLLPGISGIQSLMG
jgi:hypothetical protein